MFILLLLILGAISPRNKDDEKLCCPPIATCSYFISIKNHPTLRIKQKTYGLKPGRLLKVFKKVLNKFCSLILLLAGDVELNPGPTYVYKKTTAVFSRNSKKLV